MIQRSFDERAPVFHCCESRVMSITSGSQWLAFICL